MASEQRPVTGQWRRRGEARAQAARLILAGDGTIEVVDQDGASLASAAFAQLRISDRIGSIPRHVTFPDGHDFETADNDGLDVLIAPLAGRGHGVVHGLERFRPRLIAFVAVTLLLLAAMYRYAVPVLVEVAVLVTPPAVTSVMSQSALATLDKALFGPSTLSTERQETLRKGFAALVAEAGETDGHAYSLNFRDGGAIGPNAFALPDGTIVLTDQLVELAGTDDDQILGVLGHEIGHVDHQHSLRQLYRAAGTAGLIMLIGGDIGSGTEDILIQGAALMSLSYSRAAEADADRFSVELMHKAGRDPAAIARFFEQLRDKLGDSSRSDYLSSHPATPQRIEETRRYAREISAGN